MPISANLKPMYNSKTAVVAIILSLLFSATVIAQPRRVEMRKLNGYFFSGNESMLKKGVNCYVITSAKEFEKFFGKGRADTPHFSKEWMLMLVMPATTKDIKLDFDHVSMKAGNFMEVYCDLNKLKGKHLTYEINPLAVCAIPRFESVKTVNFYERRKSGLELMSAIELRH